jgi:hypothetical protein
MHCPREVLPNGSIKCCKDDRHSEIKAKKLPPYRAIARHHQKMHLRIDELLKEKGPNVSLNELNQYGIKLNCPVEIKSVNGHHAFHYVGFKITQTQDNKYIIEKK